MNFDHVADRQWDRARDPAIRADLDQRTAEIAERSATAAAWARSTSRSDTDAATHADDTDGDA